MKQKLAAVMSVAALVVTGCAQNSQVELDPKTVSNVHRITLVGPADPIAIAVVTQGELNAQRAVAAAAAIPFAGVLGAAIAGGVAGGISAEVARETSKPLNDEVALEKYSYAAAMRDAVAAELKGAGYDVTAVAVEHKLGGFAEKLDGVGGGQTDLIIDAVATASCTDVGTDQKAHFRPVVHLLVKLTRPGEANPIMNKDFVYDDETAALDAFHVKGDSQYDIADYAALKANVKGCLEGIKASAPTLAKAVASVVAAQKSVMAAK